MSDAFDTGVVTVMFTDVEGSTDLTRRLGDEAARRTIETHRRIVREQLAQHDGREIDSIGDGFMLTFLSTRRAIACAVAIQQALADHAREHPEEEVKLRIGLNVGEVLERGGHPFGAAVNATQRVGAHAKGGQIYVSEPVRHLAGTIPGVTFRDRGRHSLKGFSERWRLFEVVWERPQERVERTKAPAAAPGAKRRRRTVVYAAAAALAGLAGVAAFLILRSGDEPLDLVPPNSVGVIDPDGGEIVDAVQVGRSPVDITYDPERQRLWVANLAVGTISEVDAGERTVVNTFSAGSRPRGVAAGEGFVWVASGFTDELSVFDPAAGTVVDRIDIPGPRDVVVGPGGVWVVSATTGAVVHVDPRTREVEPVADGSAVAVGAGRVWFAHGRTLRRIDAATRRPVGPSVTLRYAASQLAVAEDGSVWVTHTPDDAVSRVEPADGSTQTIDVGNDPRGLAVGEGSVWVASSGGRAVIRIREQTGRIEGRIPLGSSPEAVVVAEGSVWATTQAAE